VDVVLDKGKLIHQLNLEDPCDQGRAPVNAPTSMSYYPAPWPSRPPRTSKATPGIGARSMAPRFIAERGSDFGSLIPQTTGSRSCARSLIS
jgi:hypothetical protein